MIKLILIILVVLFCSSCETKPIEKPQFSIKMYSGDKIIGEWKGDYVRIFSTGIYMDTHTGCNANSKYLCGDLEIIRNSDNKTITRTIFPCSE